MIWATSSQTEQSLQSASPVVPSLFTEQEPAYVGVAPPPPNIPVFILSGLGALPANTELERNDIRAKCDAMDTCAGIYVSALSDGRMDAVMASTNQTGDASGYSYQYQAFYPKPNRPPLAGVTSGTYDASAATQGSASAMYDTTSTTQGSATSTYGTSNPQDSASAAYGEVFANIASDSTQDAESTTSGSWWTNLTVHSSQVFSDSLQLFDTMG